MMVVVAVPPKIGPVMTMPLMVFFMNDDSFIHIRLRPYVGNPHLFAIRWRQGVFCPLPRLAWVTTQHPVKKKGRGRRKASTPPFVTGDVLYWIVKYVVQL